MMNKIDTLPMLFPADLKDCKFNGFATDSNGKLWVILWYTFNKEQGKIDPELWK